MRIRVGHTFISGRISYGETAVADERTRSVEQAVDDKLVVVEIKFGRCYLFVNFEYVPVSSHSSPPL